MRFCLDDGTTLVDRAPAGDTPTVALPDAHNNIPTMKEAFRPDVPPVNADPWALGTSTAPQKRSLLPWLLGVAALLLLGSAVVFAIVVLRPKPLPWHLTMQMDGPVAGREAAMKQTIAVLENRLDALGVSHFEVRPLGDSGNSQILVSLPGLQDPERVKRILVEGGNLELAHLISPPSPAPSQTYATKEEAIASMNSAGTIPANRRVLLYQERAEIGNSANPGKWVVVEAPPIVGGSELRTATAVRSRAGDDYEIDFVLRANGAEKFGAWTGANINEYIAVAVNDEVKSIAYIKGQIFDQGQITGRFTQQSAEDLALTLKSGALPVRLTYLTETRDK